LGWLVHGSSKAAGDVPNKDWDCDTHGHKMSQGGGMGEQSLLGLMKDWGYYLLPRSHPDSPGYSGLLVAIRE
jgi:hypothetical protein